MIGQALSLLVSGSLVGMIVLRLALWPAFRMAGIRRERGIELIWFCFLASFYWFGVTFAESVVEQHGLNIFSNWLAEMISSWIVQIALFVAGGWMIGKAAERTAPLPFITRYMARAGAGVGAFFVARNLSFNLSMQSVHEYLGWMTLVAWLLLPVGAMYWSACVQRGRIDRYGRGDCVLCNYKKAGHLARCSECGEIARHICHSCGHMVDARPGDACPRCKAEIARVCWKCGYDWRGIESDRCPECGVWKPSVGTIQ